MHKFDMKNLEKLDNPKRRELMPPDETLRMFRLEDGKKFLDIGCGIGYFTIPAAIQMGTGNATGIDISEEILQVAKERSHGIANISYLKCNEYAFPCSNQEFDYVFICNVLHEIENKEMYFSEVKRVLKDDGILCVIDWEKKSTEMGPPIEERISREQMEQQLIDANFQVEELFAVNDAHYGMKVRKR